MKTQGRKEVKEIAFGFRIGKRNTTFVSVANYFFSILGLLNFSTDCLWQYLLTGDKNNKKDENIPVFLQKKWLW